jgi:hypothetical protein
MPTKAVPWRTERPGVKPAVSNCPICDAGALEYAFVVERLPVCRCPGCGLLFLNPQPPARTEGESESATVDRREAALIFDELSEFSVAGRGHVLVVNLDCEAVAVEAAARGFSIQYSTLADLENGYLDRTAPETFDGCVLYACLERASNPDLLLTAVRSVLKKTGALLITAASVDSRAAALFRTRWWEFCRSNLFYFSPNSLQNLLVKTGYCDFKVNREHGSVSQKQLRSLGRKLTFLARLLTGISRYLPEGTTRRLFALLDSRVRIACRPRDTARRNTLSVIMPVYNERNTVGQILEEVLAKQIDGVEIEVIVVESNSTDGSREEVLRFQDHPRIRVILEDVPKGKGRAVRTGLKHATGDVVLIQDADLEYDINDYESLLRPILALEQNFIIGSRHGPMGKTWKIRQFHDSALFSQFFNLGHVFFLALFNWFYWQSLNDPFSMYKVFRRDCLYGLTFECNRFDFDHEIVIKLIRKGYRPVEIPVNYQSRSISEGKKVSIVRDPFTWIRALVKFRFQKLYAQRATDR